MNWTKAFRDELPVPCFDRPLVCDGMPDASTVIIVGENPGRNTATDWWHYWSETEGFDYDRFMRDYESVSPIRGSRHRLLRLRENLAINAVETNLFRHEALGGSKRKVSNLAVIQLLVDNMPALRAVVFHGSKAAAGRTHLSLPNHVDVISTRHFSRMSYDALDAMAAVIARQDKAPTPRR